MSHHKKMKLSKVGLATLFALFGTQQAYAQQQAEATEQNEATIEKIEVTGSRLKGVDMEGANPLQIFSRDDLAKKAMTVSALFYVTYLRHQVQVLSPKTAA